MKALSKILYRLFGVKNDFQRLFFGNEFNDLTGKSRKSIIALSLILALTISALGYAIGGIKYLKSRMDNPFTNWVDMNIKPNYKDKIPNLELHFQNVANRDTFDLSNITTYKINRFEYLNLQDNENYGIKTRTVGFDEEILKEILKPGNVIYGTSYKEGVDLTQLPKCGIIVKEQGLRTYLGYDTSEPLEKVTLVSSEFVFFPEVIAVVKELPNLCEMMISSHFSTLLNTSFDETGFVQMNAVNKISFVGKLIDEDIQANNKKIAEVFDGYRVSKTEYNEIVFNSKNKLDRIDITLSNFLEFDEIKYALTKLNKLNVLKNARIAHKNECNVGEDYSTLRNPHYIAFNFNALDKVRDFNEFLKNDPKFEMEISMDQVESKENFALVSNLTALMALILLAFSILSIVFYINSLLTTHLEGIKNNLGTLKAFGLSNKFLVSVYLKIILLFIIISLIFGYVASIIVKILEVTFNKIPVIDLFDIRIFLTMMVILVFASFVSFRTIKKILLKTPGDLIYNR